MKTFCVEVYDEETIQMMKFIKNEQGIYYAEQFRRGLRLYFLELQKRKQESENKAVSKNKRKQK